jgi:hypothetical protein
MSLTRDVARKLAQAEEIELLQRGSPIDARGPIRGPIRLRLKDRPHATGDGNDGNARNDGNDGKNV